MTASRRRPLQPALKRTFDVAGSLLVLVVLSPVMLLVSIAISLTSGPSILFRQERLGKDGHPFTLLKFRTMTDAVDEHADPLPDDRRLTRLGRFLRHASLDELPELLNVLKGDMSLVGPRPLLPQYRDLYTPFQWRRHEVKPGIAGPVQASGRNILSWEDKFRLDVEYVDTWSLWGDVKLIARSLWKAVTREGVSQPGRATVEYFQGSPEDEEG